MSRATADGVIHARPQNEAAEILQPAAGKKRVGSSAIERALDNVLARGGQAPQWVRQTRRLLRFDELDDVLSRTESGKLSDRLTALAAALEINYEFNGLEHLEQVGDRPVIVFGNHPIGSGNVVGMSLLLSNRFADHRIIGHRFMKFIDAFSEKMIPVDPFSSASALNLEALVKLRREFGSQYQALGLFPAGNSSQLKITGEISDRRWSDAFVRIARHHDALLVPVWFSGRNRLRYYVASRIRAELGFLALPSEFLRLRGKTITVNVGKPISPEMMRAVPNRKAQLSFLRAGVYELERERAKPVRNGNAARGDFRPAGATVQAAIDPVPVGKDLELRFFDGAAAERAGALAGAIGHDDLGDVSTYMILTPRDRLVSCAFWQLLDWGKFAARELDRLSPVRQAFRLAGEVTRSASNRLEIVKFGVGNGAVGSIAPRHIRMALRQTARAWKRAVDLICVVTPRETSFVLAALQFATLQKDRGDEELLRARPSRDLIGATRHHDWRPGRDTTGGDRLFDRRRIWSVDPVLRAYTAFGTRFGAAGLTADSAPCILGRMGIRHHDDSAAGESSAR
jgi:putative hemolysin